jgi:hypothetical protein
MKIVTLVNGQGHAAPLEHLAKIQCRFESELSPVTTPKTTKTWPSFGIEDGTVQFAHPSQWSLGDETTTSFECR